MKKPAESPSSITRCRKLCLTLKQGFGRLIRSLEDRGVLVLLDPRVRTQRYGRVFLQSLPPYRMTTEIADVEEFFGG